MPGTAAKQAEIPREALLGRRRQLSEKIEEMLIFSPDGRASIPVDLIRLIADIEDPHPRMGRILRFASPRQAGIAHPERPRQDPTRAKVGRGAFRLAESVTAPWGGGSPTARAHWRAAATVSISPGDAAMTGP